MNYYSNVNIIDLSQKNGTHYYTKKCTSCNIIKPATTNFFHKEKSSKYGLNAKCKMCKNKKFKSYYENTAEQQRKRVSIYHKKNKNERNEYSRNYYYNNTDHLKMKHKEWLKNNPERNFNYHNNRRIQLNKGSEITKDQWKEMMKFFEWRCAYSGEILTKENRSVDHILALSNNGENEIWNLVPMLKTLNSSKHTKEMLDWYQQQEFYSEERLEKIYKWQNYASNKWNKSLQPGANGQMIGTNK